MLLKMLMMMILVGKRGQHRRAIKRLSKEVKDADDDAEGRDADAVENDDADDDAVEDDYDNDAYDKDQYL